MSDTSTAASAGSAAAPAATRVDARTAVAELHRTLAARGETVGCAESLTGGELAALLSAPAGASACFVGGVVSYANAVKRAVLGVQSARVVTATCAEEMAAGARRLLASEWAVSTTGVAGPESQEGQPVGLVYVGLAGPRGTSSERLHLSGDREEIRALAAGAAVRLLREALDG